MKMNPELKDKWLKALRSGEFKQCIKRLAQVEPNGSFTYCCLGVYCVVAGVKAEILKNTSDILFLGEDATLPYSVMKQAGLNSPDPYVTLIAPCDGFYNGSAVQAGDKVEVTLSSLNDGIWVDRKNWTFEEIAEVIEEQL